MNQTASDPGQPLNCPKCSTAYRVKGWTPARQFLCPRCKIPLMPLPDAKSSLPTLYPPGPVPRPAPAVSRPEAPEEDEFILDLEGRETDLKKLLPEEFQGFRIKKELARGGMGAVLLAEQTALRREVALKVMLPSAESQEATAKDRFLREARSIARLQHPYLITVYEVGSVNGLPYFAMEYIAGATLGQLLDEGRLGIEQAVEILGRVARALAFAHRNGILHRDLKPGNIMVRPNGDPVLMDFGLAKDRTSQSLKLSVTGSVMGTPAYMSPEQAQGLGVDERSDVYSLGAVLYEAVAGRAPFEGATAFDTLYKVVNDLPTPPREVNPEAPAELSRICAHALEKDPQERYQTAEELADDLERHLRGEKVLARGPSAAGQARHWARRHRAAAAGAGVGLAALLLLGLLFKLGILRTGPRVPAAPGRAAAGPELPELAGGRPSDRLKALGVALREKRWPTGSVEARSALEELRQGAGAGDEATAEAALAALVEAGDGEALPVLAAQIAPERPAGVRRAAVRALGALKPQGASLPLCRVACDDPVLDIRLLALDLMPQSVDPFALTQLIRLSVRGQPRAVAEAARRKVSGLRTPQELLSLYAGSRGYAQAPEMSELGTKMNAYESQLEEALAEANPAAAAGRATPPERAPQPYEVAMVKVRSSPREQRLQAAFDLGILAREESEAALRGALLDEDGDVALAAAQSLGALPKVKEPGLIQEMLRAPRPASRMAAARALGLVQPRPDGAPLLAALAAERDAGVQCELAQALAALRPAGAAPALLALLKEGAPAARRRAAWALGQLGEKGVCLDLVAALEKAGADGELVQEISGALSALTGKSLGADPAAWREYLKSNPSRRP